MSRRLAAARAVWRRRCVADELEARFARRFGPEFAPARADRAGRACRERKPRALHPTPSPSVAWILVRQVEKPVAVVASPTNGKAFVAVPVEQSHLRRRRSSHMPRVGPARFQTAGESPASGSEMTHGGFNPVSAAAGGACTCNGRGSDRRRRSRESSRQASQSWTSRPPAILGSGDSVALRGTTGSASLARSGLAPAATRALPWAKSATRLTQSSATRAPPRR
jgi:hypothetical protein